MVVEVGTADKLDKVEEDCLIGGVVEGMSGYQVKDQRDVQTLYLTGTLCMRQVQAK